MVVETNAARRSVFLSDRAADFATAFGTTITPFEHDSGTYRGRTGSLTVPADLVAIIEGVFGIDDRPVAQPHFQLYQPTPSLGIRARATGTSFTPPALATLYNFPTDLDGTGQCIAIIELGGGYRTADLRAYFRSLGLPMPQVTAVRVDGGRNQLSTANGADGEVMLDIEVAATIAPKVHIGVMQKTPMCSKSSATLTSKHLNSNQFFKNHNKTESSQCGIYLSRGYAKKTRKQSPKRFRSMTCR